MSQFIKNCQDKFDSIMDKIMARVYNFFTGHSVKSTENDYTGTSEMVYGRLFIERRFFWLRIIAEELEHGQRVAHTNMSEMNFNLTRGGARRELKSYIEFFEEKGVHIWNVTNDSFEMECKR